MNNHKLLDEKYCTIKTLDISEVENDFIYQLLDTYLTKIVQAPPANLDLSITKLINTVINYYTAARQNELIDVETARRLFNLKTKK